MAAGGMKALVVVSAGAALAGTLAGYVLRGEADEYFTDRQFDTADSTVGGLANGYSFINPLLECETFKPSSRLAHVRLRGELREYVQGALKSGAASHVSIYFRQLNDGPWIGIEEDHPYSPASLFKVPIMIAVLREAESDPSLLSQPLHYQAVIDAQARPMFTDAQIKVGESYTVEELLARMISYSDNEAAHLLARLLGSDRLARVSEETGISRRGDNLPTAVISVRDYSAIFRLLYNATYLGREMSEKALQLLGRTTFSYGLTAQLPDSVRVAHKFGEHGVGAEGSPEKQLHDCGVVYAPGSPYLLCIMTQGRDLTELARIISGISRLAYNAVTEPRR